MRRSGRSNDREIMFISFPIYCPRVMETGKRKKGVPPTAPRVRPEPIPSPPPPPGTATRAEETGETEDTEKPNQKIFGHFMMNVEAAAVDSANYDRHIHIQALNGLQALTMWLIQQDRMHLHDNLSSIRREYLQQRQSDASTVYEARRVVAQALPALISKEAEIYKFNNVKDDPKVRELMEERLAEMKEENMVERSPTVAEYEFLEHVTVNRANALHFALRQGIRDASPNGRYLLRGHSLAMRGHVYQLDSYRRLLDRQLGGTVFNIFPFHATPDIVPLTPEPQGETASSVPATGAIPPRPLADVFQTVSYDGKTLFTPKGPTENFARVRDAPLPRPATFGGYRALGVGQRALGYTEHVSLDMNGLLGSWRTSLHEHWDDTRLLANSNIRESIRSDNLKYLVRKYPDYKTPDVTKPDVSNKRVVVELWVKLVNGKVAYNFDTRDSSKSEFEKLFGVTWPKVTQKVSDPLDWSWENRITDDGVKERQFRYPYLYYRLGALAGSVACLYKFCFRIFQQVKNDKPRDTERMNLYNEMHAIVRLSRGEPLALNRLQSVELEFYNTFGESILNFADLDRLVLDPKTRRYEFDFTLTEEHGTRNLGAPRVIHRQNRTEGVFPVSDLEIGQAIASDYAAWPSLLANRLVQIDRTTFGGVLSGVAIDIIKAMAIGSIAHSGIVSGLARMVTLGYWLPNPSGSDAGKPDSDLLSKSTEVVYNVLTTGALYLAARKYTRGEPTVSWQKELLSTFMAHVLASQINGIPISLFGDQKGWLNLSLLSKDKKVGTKNSVVEPAHGTQTQVPPIAEQPRTEMSDLPTRVVNVWQDQSPSPVNMRYRLAADYVAHAMNDVIISLSPDELDELNYMHFASTHPSGTPLTHQDSQIRKILVSRTVFPILDSQRTKYFVENVLNTRFMLTEPAIKYLLDRSDREIAAAVVKIEGTSEHSSPKLYADATRNLEAVRARNLNAPLVQAILGDPVSSILPQGTSYLNRTTLGLPPVLIPAANVTGPSAMIINPVYGIPLAQQRSFQDPWARPVFSGQDVRAAFPSILRNAKDRLSGLRYIPKVELRTVEIPTPPLQTSPMQARPTEILESVVQNATDPMITGWTPTVPWAESLTEGFSSALDATLEVVAGGREGWRAAYASLAGHSAFSAGESYFHAIYIMAQGLTKEEYAKELDRAYAMTHAPEVFKPWVLYFATMFDPADETQTWPETILSWVNPFAWGWSVAKGLTWLGGTKWSPLRAAPERTSSFFKSLAITMGWRVAAYIRPYTCPAAVQYMAFRQLLGVEYAFKAWFSTQLNRRYPTDVPWFPRFSRLISGYSHLQAQLRMYDMESEFANADVALLGYRLFNVIGGYGDGTALGKIVGTVALALVGNIARTAEDWLVRETMIKPKDPYGGSNTDPFYAITEHEENYDIWKKDHGQTVSTLRSAFWDSPLNHFRAGGAQGLVHAQIFFDRIQSKLKSKGGEWINLAVSLLVDILPNTFKFLANVRGVLWLLAIGILLTRYRANIKVPFSLNPTDAILGIALQSVAYIFTNFIRLSSYTIVTILLLNNPGTRELLLTLPTINLFTMALVDTIGDYLREVLPVDVSTGYDRAKGILSKKAISALGISDVDLYDESGPFTTRPSVAKRRRAAEEPMMFTQRLTSIYANTIPGELPKAVLDFFKSEAENYYRSSVGPNNPVSGVPSLSPDGVGVGLGGFFSDTGLARSTETSTMPRSHPLFLPSVTWSLRDKPNTIDVAIARQHMGITPRIVEMVETDEDVVAGESARDELLRRNDDLRLSDARNRVRDLGYFTPAEDAGL